MLQGIGFPNWPVLFRAIDAVRSAPIAVLPGRLAVARTLAAPPGAFAASVAHGQKLRNVIATNVM
jgi:hypothetical protein